MHVYLMTTVFSFFFRDQVVAGYGSMNAEEMIDTLLVTFRLENDRIHTMGAY